jgi:hypothetical protein
MDSSSPQLTFRNASQAPDPEWVSYLRVDKPNDFGFINYTGVWNMTITPNPEDALQVCPKFLETNERGHQLYEIQVSNSSSNPRKPANGTQFVMLADEYMFPEFRDLIVTDNVNQFMADGANWATWYQNWMLNSTGSADSVTNTGADRVPETPPAPAVARKKIDMALEGSWVFRHGMEGVWRTNGKYLSIIAHCRIAD